jgi:ferric-dicitrate binding protein FerR (iron transport regulator)
VYLKGEAFFEVAPDSLLAFKVYSGALVTHALGTAFNIRNYEDMDHKVQLTSGKVSVLHGSGPESTIYLDPGQELILGRQGRLVKKDFDANKALLWKEGILHFDKAPFNEVVATLERWYGVQINLKNSPGRSIIVSAEFQKDYLSNVLNSLGYSFGFSYTLHQKKVTIQFNGNTI